MPRVAEQVGLYRSLLQRRIILFHLKLLPVFNESLDHSLSHFERHKMSQGLGTLVQFSSSHAEKFEDGLGVDGQAKDVEVFIGVFVEVLDHELSHQFRNPVKFENDQVIIIFLFLRYKRGKFTKITYFLFLIAFSISSVVGYSSLNSLAQVFSSSLSAVLRISLTLYTWDTFWADL